MSYRLLTVFILVSSGLLLIGILAVSASKPPAREGLIEEYIPIVQRQPPAQVSEIFVRSTRFGDVRIIGVVESLTSWPIHNVSVQVRGYDLDQQTIVTFTVTTIFTATLPDQVNVFDLNTGIQSLLDISAEVISWDDTGSVLYAPVSVIDVDTFPTAIGQFITATLKNEQSQTLHDIVGLFWHETEWFGHELQLITDQLEPGEIYVYKTFVYMSPWVEPNIIIQGRVDP